jgi:transcriptional regulator with XRE-family HTH domain
LEEKHSAPHPIERTGTFSQPERMKPIPKRATDKGAQQFRRQVADRLQILIPIVGGNKVAAKIMGIGKTRLSNWMSPDNPNMASIEHLAILCKTTGCTLDYIFRGVQAGLTAELADKIREAESQIAHRPIDNVSRIDQADREPPGTRRRA